MFAIGEMKSTSGAHATQWFDLYPKKLNNKGWWHYKGKNSDKSSTGKFLLHSRDKIKSGVEGILVNDLVCWADIYSVINTSQKFEKIDADKSEKFFFQDLFVNVKVIANIEMV